MLRTTRATLKEVLNRMKIVQKFLLGIKSPLLIILSVVLMMVLMIISLPNWLDCLRPQLVVLMLIYWMLNLPNRVGIMFVWIVGLILDVLYNVPLGEHALSLILIAYIVLKWQVRIGFFNFGQKIALVFALIVLYQLPMFLFALSAGKIFNTWSYWISPFISALIWPYLEKCAGRWKSIVN